MKTLVFGKKEESRKSKKYKKSIFKKRKITSEFNQELKIRFIKNQTNNKIIDNQNNFGSQNYEGSINKIGNYKFSK